MNHFYSRPTPEKSLSMNAGIYPEYDDTHVAIFAPTARAVSRHLLGTPTLFRLPVSIKDEICGVNESEAKIFNIRFANENECHNVLQLLKHRFGVRIKNLKDQYISQGFTKGNEKRILRRLFQEETEVFSELKKQGTQYKVIIFRHDDYGETHSYAAAIIDKSIIQTSEQGVHLQPVDERLDALYVSIQ